jgi:hypothetical protein
MSLLNPNRLACVQDRCVMHVETSEEAQRAERARKRDRDAIFDDLLANNDD